MALIWMTAEKELLQNDFNGNTSQFDLFIESPRDPKVTTILSMTTHSMIVCRSHARHAGEVGGGPDVASVHLFPEEIDTTKTNVNGWMGSCTCRFQRRIIEIQPDLRASYQASSKLVQQPLVPRPIPYR